MSTCWLSRGAMRRTPVMAKPWYAPAVPFCRRGYYAPFQKALAELCLEYAPECGETHLLDAGCGEGSYDCVVYDAFAAQGRPCVLAGFDLSKDAIRLAAKLLPEAAFAVGGSFSAPVRDGWADVLLNIFSPFAEQEFCREAAQRRCAAVRSANGTAFVRVERSSVR